MEKLFRLLDKYIETYESIHANREKIKSLTADNQEYRDTLETIKKELEPVVLATVEKQSLYRVCMDKYGKIDKHFHTLYALFGNKL